MGHHWARNTWGQTVDAFIVATQFSRERHVKAGISPEKIKVLPHFTEEQVYSPPEERGDYALYAGRLSPEKGVDLLLEGWRKVKGLLLYITGTGPEQKRMEDYSHSIDLL
jgi:glycosyltransferase involved in cell wall biosynthesis